MSRLPRTDLLIKAARAKSLNKDFGENYGLDDDFFLTSIRQAVTEIQSYLVGQFIELNSQYYTYTCVPGQESYALPWDLFSDNLVYGIDYSYTGNTENYVGLSKMAFRDFSNGGHPERFAIDGNNFYLDFAPTSSSAKLRLRYERRIARADLVRGVVFSYSGTSLNLSSASLDSTAFETTPEYVCVCNRRGESKMANLPVQSWDSSNNLLTIYSDFVAKDGESIAAGDFVTIGENTTTHIELYPVCENYIIEYAKNEAYESQSSEDQSVSNPKLEKLMQRIASVYEYNSGGKTPIVERRDD